MSRRPPPTSDWKAPANADLLKHGAASAKAPPDDSYALVNRTWWRSLPRKIATFAVLVLLALLGAIYLAGGVDPMASLLLRKETANFLPGAPPVRRLALAVMARRPASPDVLTQLARLAHVLDPRDPLWKPVVSALSGLLGLTLPEQDDPPGILAALDAATARAVNRPLDDGGVLGWRALDPYFIEAVEEIASSDPAVGAHRFNSMRPPEGLPTSEWYLDELVSAFGDARPVAFVLVADSTGADWRPTAMSPDQVAAHARRIPAATVGEALRIGLWGLEDHRPETPDADPVAWWSALARSRGLPNFAAAP